MVTAEFNGCHDCIARLAVRYVFGYAHHPFVHIAGGDTDAAAKVVERGLAEDIDSQQG